MPTAQLDPRDPESRIARLLDDGKFEFLLPRTDCGMVAVTGDIKGNKVIVFASDPTINIDDLDPAVTVDVVRDKPRALPAGDIAALNDSFGFGGHNVVLVFKSI